MTTLALHTLRNTPGARRAKKNVGRGRASGHGKTSGRGHKGQYARSGHKHKPGFEGGQMRLIRRIPKRGFVHAARAVWAVVPVSRLAVFAEGEAVTPENLAAKGLVRGRYDAVKILAGGACGRKLSVKAHGFSAAARAAIEAAGGTCDVIKR
jgi:large subunit ribosomal protein L15